MLPLHVSSAGRQHRFKDPRVSRTAAKIAREAFANVVFGGLRGLRASRLTAASTIPGRADAALRAAVRDERLLYGVQLVSVRDSFDGADLAPSACSTGTRQLFTSAPSSSHATCAALAFAAAFLHSRQPGSSRSTSSSRAIGYASSDRGLPFTVESHAIFFKPQACTPSSISLRTSGVTGMRVMFTPVACSMAFAIAGAVPSSGNSPMPFAPPGPRS